MSILSRNEKLIGNVLFLFPVVLLISLIVGTTIASADATIVEVRVAASADDAEEKPSRIPGS